MFLFVDTITMHGKLYCFVPVIRNCFNDRVDFNHRPQLVTYKHNYHSQKTMLSAFILWDNQNIARNCFSSWQPLFTVTFLTEVMQGDCKTLTDVQTGNKRSDPNTVSRSMRNQPTKTWSRGRNDDNDIIGWKWRVTRSSNVKINGVKPLNTRLGESFDQDLSFNSPI